MPDHNDRFGDLSESADNTGAAESNAAAAQSQPTEQVPPPLLDQFSPQKPGQPPWVWAGMGALVLLALFVIFVLPVIVQDYELPLERRVEESLATEPVTPQQRAETGVSPFLEAQRARERKDAQDVLAEL
ncbi:MAG: hypothetical protein P8M31_09420, partial [Gammaproteobacteria bacterium]|nr:hypothetical protein [Gammaproteobacteria bacterium]